MRFIYMFAGLVVFSLVVSLALAGGSLDGTQWRLEITPSGEKVPFYIDRIVFKDGKFVTMIFERKGFMASRYNLTEKAGGLVVWETTQTSDAEGTLSWHGELKGEAMVGSVGWKQPDGTIVNHTFTSSRVTEEPPAPESVAPAPKAKKPPASKSKAPPPASP